MMIWGVEIALRGGPEALSDEAADDLVQYLAARGAISPIIHQDLRASSVELIFDVEAESERHAWVTSSRLAAWAIREAGLAHAVRAIRHSVEQVMEEAAVL